MAAPPRRHHIIPDFYLRRFSRAGTIQVIDRENGRSFPSSTKKVAVERDRHTRTGSGTADYEVEKELGRLEGIASGYLAAVDRGEFPFSDPDARLGMSLFLAFLHNRTDKTRHETRQLLASLAGPLLQMAPSAIIVQVLTKRRGRPPTDEEIATEQSRLRALGDTLTDTDIDVDRDYHINTMIRLSLTQVELFSQRRWGIVDLGLPVLLTSDAPVRLIRHRDLPPHYGVGVATARAIVVPLDPCKFLFLSDQPGDEGILAAPSLEFANLSNNTIWNGARRWVFHHPDHPPQHSSVNVG